MFSWALRVLDEVFSFNVSHLPTDPWIIGQYLEQSSQENKQDLISQQMVYGFSNDSLVFLIKKYHEGMEIHSKRIFRMFPISF